MSDLETNLPEITKAVHATDEPVFLTEKGYGSNKTITWLRIVSVA
jgi:hypothetical protein